jgi:hypothetical protein
MPVRCYDFCEKHTYHRVFMNLANIPDTSILYGLQKLHHHWVALDKIQDDSNVDHLPHKLEVGRAAALLLFLAPLARIASSGSTCFCTRFS